MTRDEELQQQAMSLIGFSSEVSREDAIKLAYYFGAKYADETMLDKVCKWLKENVEYAVMKKNGKYTIELAGIELAEDLQKDMRI